MQLLRLLLLIQALAPPISLDLLSATARLSSISLPTDHLLYLSSPHLLNSPFSHLADLAESQIISNTSPLCTSRCIASPPQSSSSPHRDGNGISEPSKRRVIDPSVAEG